MSSARISSAPDSRPKKSASGLKLLRRLSLSTNASTLKSFSSEEPLTNIKHSTVGSPLARSSTGVDDPVSSSSDYRMDTVNSEASSSGTTLSSSPNATTISSRDCSFLMTPSSSSAINSDSNSHYHSQKHTRATSLSLYSIDSAKGGLQKGSKSEINSRKSSLSRKSGKRASFGSKERWIQEFKALDSELAKFIAKSGVNKANILRLTLLPFLRQSKGFPDNYDGPKIIYPRTRAFPFPSSSSSFTFLDPSSAAAHIDVETTFKIKTLQKWWSHSLITLKQRNAINGADRSVYLEALSGLMSRPEWLNNIVSYRALLFETLQLVISKLDQKTVPLFMSAFAGKVLAYSFFWIPGVSQVLINTLNIHQSLTHQIFTCCFEKQISLEFHLDVDDLGDDCYESSIAESAGAPSTASASESTSESPDERSYSFETFNLNKAIRSLQPFFFDHLHSSMGYKDGLGLPLDPELAKKLFFMISPGSVWARRWSCVGSDLFMSFIKHYYSIISVVFLESKHKSPWVNTHLAAPGLLVFHGYVLRELNNITKGPEKRKVVPTNDYNTVAITAIPSMGKRRVDQLKVLSVIREILHNDEFSVQFYERYCRQFENILHAVALSTPLHDMDACVIFTDLAEEYLASLILTHPLSTQRVLIYKDKAIEWDFWITVAQKMLQTESSFTVLRALSFLFNIWEHIPLGMGSQAVYTSGQTGGFDLFDDYDSYRWRLTTWLLSPEMWKKFFCHWQPLVRAYYHRLLCWRIASVGPESDLLCSVLFSNYNSDARNLLGKRFKLTLSKVQRLVSNDIEISFDPCLPVLHRKLKIGLNMAASPNLRSARSAPASPRAYSSTTNTSSGSVIPSAPLSNVPVGFSGRIDPYDVFDDNAYSYLVANPSFGPGSSGAAASSLNNNRPLAPHSELNLSGAMPVQAQAETTNASSVEPCTPLPSGKKLGRVTSLTSFFRRKSSQAYKNNNPEIISETPKNLRKYISNNGTSSCVDRGMSDLKRSIDYVRPSADQIAADSSPRACGSDLSLTTSLVPPPPQLLRPQPEIRRPLYRFGLDYCESSVRKQMDLVMGKRRSSPNVNLFRMRLLGRLPFDYSRPVNQSESLLEYYDGEDDEADEGESTVDPAIKDSATSVATSRNSRASRTPMSPVSMRDDVNSVYYSATNSATVMEPGADSMPSRPVINKNMLMSEDDTKFWKYAGRSLSEWEQVVTEFEEFVRSSKMVSGVSRLEDIKAPFLVAEIPAKAFGAA